MRLRSRPPPSKRLQLTAAGSGVRQDAHGLGPYGNFVNDFRVRCIYLNTEYRVFVDPHHPNYAEPQAVPGFVAAGPPDRKRVFWFEW